MTLSERIAIGSRKASRLRQARAERRLDEIVDVAGIGSDYERHDQSHDEAIRQAFATVYRLVDSTEEKEAVAAAFATWTKNDERKDGHLYGRVGQSVNLLKTNNDYWLDDGCGPDGRAA